MKTNSIRIVYAGTPEFSVAALKALIASPHQVVAVYTQPDRPAGRGCRVSTSAVKDVAVAHNIPIYQPHAFKETAAIQQLKALKPDLMVVTAYGLLLPEAVLAIPRLGCINIHASLLPRWRGAAPIQRAILAGDNTTGITIMQMDKGLDTGNMLARATCEIKAQETASQLHDKLMQLGAKTLIQNIDAIINGAITPQIQNDKQAIYANKLTKKEAKINWQHSALQIERAVRAYNSWPVAHCYYLKKQKQVTLRIWQATVVTRKPQNLPAGTVIAETQQGIEVQTGEGILRIEQLQTQGKRQMLASDFLHANSLLGQVLT
jgi:methionyl-tRNA formyltransferase